MSDLKLTYQITQRENTRLDLRLTGPGGEATTELDSPTDALLTAIAQHDPTRIPPAAVRNAGEALWKVLLCEAIDELAQDTLLDGRKQKQPVQVELRFDADQIALARFPWEMLCSPQGEYPVQAGLIDLTRYISYPQPPPTFSLDRDQRPLLHAIADPDALPPIAKIALAVKNILDVPNASFDSIEDKLLIERINPWGFHFDGHGAVVQRCGTCGALNSGTAETCRTCSKPLTGAERLGALAFDREEQPEWITSEQLAAVLYNADVQLITLMACDSARLGSTLVFSGMAPRLILAGVPAVLGMQYPVLDNFANAFSNTFYRVLESQNDLLAAVRTARQKTADGAWYSPVVYVRHLKSADTKPANAGSPIYETRQIDTAAPAKVAAAAPFLTRLWLRRPETKALTDAELRAELDIPDSVEVISGAGQADVKFEPLPGRTLRRGEVTVKLLAPGADVQPEKMTLFIDEKIDAPPAIFVVTPRKTGKLSLIYSVEQDGGTIHSIKHRVEVVETLEEPAAQVTHSETVAVGAKGEEEKKAAAIPGGVPRMEDTPAKPEVPRREPADDASRLVDADEAGQWATSKEEVEEEVFEDSFDELAESPAEPEPQIRDDSEVEETQHRIEDMIRPDEEDPFTFLPQEQAQPAQPRSRGPLIPVLIGVALIIIITLILWGAGVIGPGNGGDPSGGAAPTEVPVIAPAENTATASATSTTTNTPTPTLTPTATFTPTPTLTPTWTSVPLRATATFPPPVQVTTPPISTLPPVLVPLPICGNGTVESGEQCEADSDCGSGFYCESNCTCLPIPG